MKRTLLGLLLLSSLPAYPAGRGDEVLYDSGFRMSKNGMQAENTRNFKLAPEGSCAGISAFNRIYWQAQKEGRVTRPLAEVTAEIAGLYGQTYVNEVANVLQAVSRRTGWIGVGSGFHAPSTETTQRILSEFDKHPGDLVSITLYRRVQGDDRFHRVEVTGAVKTGAGRVEFQVADPKAGANHPQADKARLYWDQDRWNVVNDTGVYDVYTNLGIQSGPPSNRADFWRVLDYARRGLSVEQMQAEFRKQPPFGRSKFDALIDKVNGVMVRFDPELFDGAASEEELEAIAARFHEFVERGEEGVLHLEPRERRETIHRVRLRDVAGAATLGPLTRVRGFVRDAAGEIHLLGIVEEGRPPISTDLLVVALATVWKRGLSPFVSLDPDPANIAGPQKVRIGQVPEDLRATEFVRILLEADYAMKEIELGQVSPQVAGFQRFYDLVREHPSTDESCSRFWLLPLSLPVGDILETREGEAVALLFESEVQVLTESMKAAEGGFLGTGAADPVAEDAAANLTRFYRTLEEKEPRFRNLRIAFDLAKLAAILRAKGVAHEALEAMAARKPARVEVRESYPGIGPKRVEGTEIVLSGGAESRRPVSKRAVVETDRLAPLLTQTGPVEIALPAVLDVRGAAAAALNVEMQLTRVMQEIRSGLMEEALRRLDFVLTFDPDRTDASTIRAGIRVSVGRPKEALEDVERAIRDSPRLQSLRAAVRSRMGDAETARRDAREAALAFPDDETVAAWNALAYVELMDWDAADGELNRLALLSPGNPFVHLVRRQIRTYRRLGPDRTRERMKRMRELPTSVSAPLASAFVLLTSDPRSAAALLESALQAATGPMAKELAVRERCLFLMAVAHVMATMRSGGEEPRFDYAARLAEIQPGRPSTHAAAAMLAAARGGRGEEILKRFDAAIAAKGERDPVFEDLAAELGTDRVLSWVGLVLLLRSDGEETLGIFDRILRLSSDLPEAGFLQGLRDQGAAVVGAVVRGADASRHLESFRAAAKRVPARLSSDLAATALVTSFYRAYLLCERGEPLRRACLDYLRLTKSDDPPDLLVDNVAQGRAAAAGLYASELLKGSNRMLEDRGFSMRSFEGPGRDLEAAVSAKDADRAKTALRDLTEEMRRAARLMQGAMAEECGRVAQEAGPLAGILVEFALAVTQRRFERPEEEMGIPSPDFLRETAEYKEFVGSVREFVTYTKRSLADLWSAALGASAGPADEATLLATLRQGFVAEMRPRIPELDRFELELKTRMRTGIRAPRSSESTLRITVNVPTAEAPKKLLWPFIAAGGLVVVAIGFGAWALRRRRKAA